MQQQFETERQVADSRDKGHGRIEHRRLLSTTAVNDYLNWLVR